MRRNIRSVSAFIFAAGLLVAACGGSDSSSDSSSSTKLKVFGAFATAKEEPWDGVIDAALQAAEDAGTIEYTSVDKIGYDGDMERVLRETCQKDKPDVIFGDAFGNEEAVR